MADCPSIPECSADHGPNMVGLRPGWNDEAYFFHPDSTKTTDRRCEEDSAKWVLRNIAKDCVANGLVPPNDIDTKIAVVAGFRFYESFGLREVARIERNLKSLPKYDAALIPFDLDEYIQNMKSSLATNQLFLNDISSELFEALVESLFQNATHNKDSETEEESYDRASRFIAKMMANYVYEMDNDEFLVSLSSARSTVKQFVRDWSDVGSEERDQAYGPLLDALTRYLPNPRHEDGTLRRVVCPGSGLGRLPFEVLMRGFGAQGNEYSHSMLIASDFILNHTHKAFSMPIYPYVLQSNNRNKRDHIFQKALIPDLTPSKQFSEILDQFFPDYDDLPDGHVFSMTEGEFVEGYDQEVDQWDVVLCSFFLDTAQNIIQYIKTMARILAPGGYLMSNGPLLYHYAESDNKPSIELSYEDLKHVLSQWFDIEEERDINAYYASNGNSLMRTQYTTKFFVAKRNGAENPPPSTDSIFNFKDEQSEE